jgi:hypothetical protein
MTDEQDGPVDLTDHSLEVLAVPAAQTSQRVRRSDHRHTFAEKLVVQTAKAGRVSERAVDQDDGGISHGKLPFQSDERAITITDRPLVVKSPNERATTTLVESQQPCDVPVLRNLPLIRAQALCSIGYLLCSALKGPIGMEERKQGQVADLELAGEQAENVRGRRPGRSVRR